MGWGEIDTYSKKFKKYFGSIFKEREKRREKRERERKKKKCAGQNGGWMGEVEGD